MSANLLVSRLVSFVDSQGGDFQDWCCGTSEDAEATLFAHHNVDVTCKSCLVEQASSAKEAQEIQHHLLQRGFQPGHEGRSDRAVYVFVYKIDEGTTE